MLRTAKGLLHAAIGLLAVIGISDASAQSYPAKPVRLMVGFAPGGGTDVTARIFAQKLTGQLGQPMVVENRSGAAGSLAAAEVAKSPPDGYRLLMVASSTFINTVLSANPSYSFERDFTPLTFVTISPLVLVVHPSVPARTASDLVTLARSRPGQLNFGSDGIGGTSHLAGELFNMLSKVKLLHVPFKGNADTAMAIAGGQIDIGFPSLASATPLMTAGKFRALAITSLKRSQLMLSLPTLDESGLPGYDLVSWFGFLGPAGLPKPIVDKLHAVSVAVANAPDVREALAKQGVEVETKSPEEFAAFMRDQAVQISRLGKVANIKLD
jgi:tripartite-type tricarboxylate transporter receptor subunit TctC